MKTDSYTFEHDGYHITIEVNDDDGVIVGHSIQVASESDLKVIAYAIPFGNALACAFQGVNLVNERRSGSDRRIQELAHKVANGDYTTDLPRL